jgi:hypothetical protein
MITLDMVVAAQRLGFGSLTAYLSRPMTREEAAKLTKGEMKARRLAQIRACRHRQKVLAALAPGPQRSWPHMVRGSYRLMAVQAEAVELTTWAVPLEMLSLHLLLFLAWSLANLVSAGLMIFTSRAAASASREG